MDKIGRLLSVVDKSLNSGKRRHIAGGVFMSVALLFGGLAVTIFTVKLDQEEQNNVKTENKVNCMEEKTNEK